MSERVTPPLSEMHASGMDYCPKCGFIGTPGDMHEVPCTPSRGKHHHSLNICPGWDPETYKKCRDWWKKHKIEKEPEVTEESPDMNIREVI